MNKLSLRLIVPALLLAVPLILRAESPVNFPQGNVAWSVDITEKAGTSPGPASKLPPNVPPPALPTHVEITQIDGVKRIVTTWNNGKTSEKWAIPGLPVTFFEDPRTGNVRPRQNGSAMERIANRELTYDAFAFAWVKPEDLQEKDPVEYHGKRCYHYVGASSTPDPDVHRASGKLEAWIDATNGLPVALDTGDSLTVFSFQEKPPQGPLTPPPKFQEEILYYRTVMGFPQK